MKKIIVLLLPLISLCSCEEKEKEKDTSIQDYEIEREQEFGGVYVKISIEDINELGFSYVDSVNVEFDNGKSPQDMLQII